MATKRKLAAMTPVTENPVDPADELMFLCLGGGNEVGRSCHIIQYKGKTVMLDAGMHPAYDGIAALPFYDDFDLSTVDVLLISHFHIDHAASLPYVMAKTNFKGRVFMTHPTKAIYKWLIQDSVRLSNTSSSSSAPPLLYSEADHLATFPQIESIDYHTTHTISSIRITPYPAGHVLGAAMFLIEIAGLSILFTGDYSREHDRHLVSATPPPGVKIDVLITESTYGIASHVPRLEREAALMKSITSILNRGGRCLMPVFALGRAQELLLILDEYWANQPQYQRYPIYYASSLARKCMVVYQTYISFMNANIKRLFRESLAEAEAQGNVGAGGPWDFKYIRSLKNLERFDDVGGCVMLASPGMLQSGVSRELLERWAPDQRNGVIITGYSVEGTMARVIMTEPESITAVMGRSKGGGRRGETGEKVSIPRRCSVLESSFAAHVDGVENREFIEEVAPSVVILVHGEKNNMLRLKSKLLSLNAHLPPDKPPTKVFSPRNCEELRIPFVTDKIAKVVGRLAQDPPPTSGDEASKARLMTGVLVQNDFKMSLMHPDDLREYAGLTTTSITCRQKLTLSAAGTDLIKWALEGTFGAVDVVGRPGQTNGKGESNGKVIEEEADVVDDDDHAKVAYLVMGCVTVTCATGGKGEVDVSWEGNMLNDGIADAVLAVLFTVESSPAAVKQSSIKNPHTHHHDHEDHNVKLEGLDKHRKGHPHANVPPTERLDRLLLILENQFGNTITPITHPKPTGIPSDTPPSTAAGSPATKDGKEETEEFSEAEKTELARLHNLGIPVPGLEIRVDKHVAIIWLETLEVECANRALRDRVGAVVERGVETVAPLWGAGGLAMRTKDVAIVGKAC